MSISAVVAAIDLPKGLTSLPGVGPIDLKTLFDRRAPAVVFHADIQDNYLHIVEFENEKGWAHLVSVAKNCHEQNIEITSSSQGLILRTIRPVKAYEKLFVWIGVDLLSRLEFPFLKPSNIRGNQAYHCHKCGRVFEDPNPLKIHLSFFCKNQEFSPSQVTKCWNHQLLEFFPCFETQTYENKSKVHEINHNMIKFNGNLSCMQSVIPEDSFCGDNNGLSFSDRTRNSTIEKESDFQQVSGNLTSPSASYNWLSNNANLSQGHVCAFCGKIYSRKYGLKIHVRTHTGYKPLKCKYCFRPFSDPSNLNKHVRLHSETDAPYRCLQCGKVLVRRRDLERHMKSRHPAETNSQKC